MSIAPFVVFQALLCARDDYQQGMYGESQRHKQPTATEVVTPILVLLGWIWIAVSIISFSMKTAFQVSILFCKASFDCDFLLLLDLKLVKYVHFVIVVNTGSERKSVPRRSWFTCFVPVLGHPQFYIVDIL